MGCVSSRRDINDIHPNIFQVMNVDEQLQQVSLGQLEVTESELVLYQRGNAATRWPLRCLRRYGFDEDIFSFESGRRCPTGPGIYAFRCRRAEQLFNLLQQNIQLRNLSEELATVTTEPSLPPPVTSRQPAEQIANTIAIATTTTTIPYLDSANTTTITTNNPNSNNSSSRSVLPRAQNQNNSRFSRPGSITSNGPASPPSASSPIPMMSDSTVAISEHNNNKRIQHSYSNTLPLLDVENSLVTSKILNNSNSITTITAQQPYINLEPTSSPTLSSSSEPYAQLNMDINSECCHVYVNVTPGKTEIINNNSTTITPLISTAAAVNDIDQQQKTFLECDEEKDDPKHCYANLNPGSDNIIDTIITTSTLHNVANVKTLHHQHSLNSTSSGISLHCINNTIATTTSLPVVATESRKINYIVLDLESKHDGKNNVSCTVPSSSADIPKKTAKGYATIDFNKTVALSHSVNPCLDLDNEGSRKTRHNSTIGELAPIIARHSTSLSD